MIRTRTGGGLRSFVSVDEGIDGAIETAVQAGAALVAAHPYDVEEEPNPVRRPGGLRGGAVHSL